MIKNEKDVRRESVLSVAGAMMAAARTAPKAKGTDRLEIITVAEENDLGRLAEEMRRYSAQSGLKFFMRDALNVEQCEAAVIIGTGLGVGNLNCGYCGFDTCAQKEAAESVPCAFNIGDLGIALGSAASVAADWRIDTRVMYSVGRAALDLGLLPGCRAAFGIVLSCAGKNPFFDRVFDKK